MSSDKPALNLTATRLKVLRFLADKPNGHNAKDVVAECCPRGLCVGFPLHYTEQGLARMTGKVMKPLRDAGLVVEVDWTARMASMRVRLTEAGRELLAHHDEQASRAALASAVHSGK